MKRHRKYIFITLVVLAVFLCIQIVKAATSARPGTEFDPLVTKSYVDEQINNLLKSIGNNANTPSGSQSGGEVVNSQLIENLNKDVNDLTLLIIDAYREISDLKSQNSKLLEKVNQLESGFTVVHIDKGENLIAGGGTEIILRSGTATVIDNGNNGLVDATSGIELRQGQSAPLNHVLIASRNDGRGITATSTDGVFALVRGTYNIK